MKVTYNLPVDYNALTQPERRVVREQYRKEQDDKCYHCGEPLTGPPAPEIEKKWINWRLFPGGEKFLRYPVHLHHNHFNGLTIGAVHARCNAVLWQYHGE